MSPHHHTHTPHEAGRPDATRRLALVLGLTAVYALAEVIGGWLSNSLALLADAGHMLTDIMALALALLAAWSRAARPTRRAPTATSDWRSWPPCSTASS